MKVGVGFTLQPEARYLELLDRLLRSGPDYFEVAPETCWRPSHPEAPFEPNGFHQAFLELGRATGNRFVAHGVGFSVGSAQPDPDRRRRWLRAIERDHSQFNFEWYTDHLGISVIDGHEVWLPLPLPYTPAAAHAVADSLVELQSVVPDVGVENSVFYYHLGDPLAEAPWLRRALSAPRTHLLLDLHNVHTTAINAGFDPEEYLAALPLERVIEIHISGGTWSDPAWLASQRVLRLDSHDDAVPDEVWQLLEGVLPRCPHLRGVTLERMEGTVEPEQVPLLTEEFQRLTRTLELVGVR